MRNKKFATCEQCGEPIYVGEECIYDTRDSFYIHENCKQDYIETYMDNTLTNIAAEEYED